MYIYICICPSPGYKPRTRPNELVEVPRTKIHDISTTNNEKGYVSHIRTSMREPEPSWGTMSAAGHSIAVPQLTPTSQSTSKLPVDTIGIAHTEICKLQYLGQPRPSLRQPGIVPRAARNRT